MWINILLQQQLTLVSLVDMVWILLITKIIFPFFLVVFFLGCASQTQRAPRVEVIEKQELAPLVAGPQSPSSLFIDRTEEYGLEGVEGVRFYAIDLNGNNVSDLVVLPDFYSVPQFFLFDKDSKKFILQEDINLPGGQRSSFLLFFDFNQDGVIDAISVTLNQRSELTPRPIEVFKGSMQDGALVFDKQEGAISEFTEPVASLLVLDYDLDGKLDLFQANWYDMTQSRRPIIPDRLYRGLDLVFKEDSARLLGERTYDSSWNHFPQATPSFQAQLCDINLNGFPDILVSASSGHSNRMWINTTRPGMEGRFFEDRAEETLFGQDQIGREIPLGGGNTFFAECTDYNNNGLMDILLGELTHSYDPESRDRSSFLTNSRKEFPAPFIRTEYQYDHDRPETQADRSGLFVDLNRNGLIDVLVDNSGFPPHSRLMALVQESDHSFSEQGKELGIDIVNPVGTIVLDVNRDGRMDILTGQINMRDQRIPKRVYLFENNIPFDNNRSLRIYLRGEKSHYSATGARVLVSGPSLTQQRMNSTQVGPQPSQQEEGLFFGLGDKRGVLKVQVHWPVLDGNKPLVRNYDLSKLKFDRHLEITLCESGRTRLGRHSSCRPQKGP
jgi:enediyne biosynthesis protein E4